LRLTAFDVRVGVLRCATGETDVSLLPPDPRPQTPPIDDRIVCGVLTVCTLYLRCSVCRRVSVHVCRGQSMVGMRMALGALELELGELFWSLWCAHE
jgi:hypothetical protein